MICGGPCLAAWPLMILRYCEIRLNSKQMLMQWFAPVLSFYTSFFYPDGYVFPLLNTSLRNARRAFACFCYLLLGIERWLVSTNTLALTAAPWMTIYVFSCCHTDSLLEQWIFDVHQDYLNTANCVACAVHRYEAEKMKHSTGYLPWQETCLANVVRQWNCREWIATEWDLGEANSTGTHILLVVANACAHEVLQTHTWYKRTKQVGTWGV